ncbi:MAG: TPR domain protein, putative component of TonB system [uncultured Thiotrichaceae bacterium]|uniref:TPR domain protein, putative component of TonB system n=1 Tax=uncultured Thiotrichaceae bacterium TaxID=298394 RepID=A0A6S6TV80_9GAMM|nr:MAG: TPR domain protein, putative component of TonB system [uncultured Thiotrichaceae bacterium]
MEHTLELSALVNSGEIAIIPIGFRCHTFSMLKDKLGIDQARLPFDLGFFPPHAVASVLTRPKINLEFDDNGQSHAVCTMNESNIDPKYGLGIKFNTSTYDEINKIVVDRNIENINMYLDSTFGYYTLDKFHKFVLAHYNWHRFSNKLARNWHSAADNTNYSLHSSPDKSKGIADPRENLQITNNILNNRISRMVEVCNTAKHIVFVFENSQNYKYMQIDNEYFKLDDFSTLNEVCNKQYGSKFSLINTSEVEDIVEFFKRFT